MSAEGQAGDRAGQDTRSLGGPLARALAKAVALVALMAVMACGEGEPAPGITPEAMLALGANAALPDSLAEGRANFEEYCLRCHGEAATGTEVGPPLVHRVYHPSHHADPAFFLAPVRGVRAHHWGFGDMEPVEAVTRGEVATIVGYVRWLQRQAGIY